MRSNSTAGAHVDKNFFNLFNEKRFFDTDSNSTCAVANLAH